MKGPTAAVRADAEDQHPARPGRDGEVWDSGEELGEEAAGPVLDRHDELPAIGGERHLRRIEQGVGRITSC